MHRGAVLNVCATVGKNSSEHHHQRIIAVSVCLGCISWWHQSRPSQSLRVVEGEKV